VPFLTRARSFFSIGFRSPHRTAVCSSLAKRSHRFGANLLYVVCCCRRKIKYGHESSEIDKKAEVEVSKIMSASFIVFVTSTGLHKIEKVYAQNVTLSHRSSNRQKQKQAKTSITACDCSFRRKPIDCKKVANSKYRTLS
jgi:hypothetical protein